MANLIKFRRGKRSDLPILAQGEPGYCTDTGEVFIGDGAENHQFVLVESATEFDMFRVLGKDASHAVGGIGFVPGVTDEDKCLYPYTILEIGARCDIAGSGSSTIIEVKKNGSSILSTPITIEDGETSSRTASTQPVISDGSVIEGDIITYYFTQVATTPGKGLCIWMRYHVEGS